MIKTEADYKTALIRVEGLMAAQPGTSENEELGKAATLIKQYEDLHFPIEDHSLERAVCLALMTVRAARPASDGTEYPVLDFDPDFDDLPFDHTQGTDEDPITQEAVLRLARAAIATIRARDGDATDRGAVARVVREAAERGVRDE